MENEKQVKETDLTTSAQWDEIKKAYREHMKACHPELQPSDGTQLVRVTVEEAHVDAAHGELKRFVTDTGSFYAIPEEVVEAHLESKKRAAEFEAQNRITAVPLTTSPSSTEMVGESENRIWAKELFKASAAFLCFVVLFVVAFQTGLVSTAMKKFESTYQNTSLLDPAQSETVQLPALITNDTVIQSEAPKGKASKVITAKGKEVAKTNTAPAKAVAPVLKEENTSIGYDGLLSFDELQRRRSRARLSPPADTSIVKTTKRHR